MSLGAGLRLGLGTLTIVPVGEIQPLPRSAGRTAMLAAPLVVLPVAAAAGVVFWLATLVGAPPLVSAGLVLAVLAIGTRAMHLDGLADTIDGFGGGWTRDRALEIMHRGDVGPMGAVAIGLTMLIQAGSLAALAPLPWAGLLVATAICLSRWAATALCTRPVPAARESGMGSVVARSVPTVAAAVTLAVVTLALVGAVAATTMTWWWAPVAVGAMLLTIGIFAIMATRKFGGITGDVLGAAIELALTALLVALAIGAAA